MFNKRILLMDDDESFCEVMTGILQELGYFTSTVSNGSTAIDEYKKAAENDNRFSIVIMDLSVKDGMDGEEASQKILDFDPNAIIIISSGYSNRKIISKYKEHGLKGVLLKPYTLSQLKAVLDEFTWLINQKN